MTEPVVEAPIPAYGAAEAKALIDSAAKLMLAEREMVRQVREYATKHNISAADAQAYIDHLNGNGAAPAWLAQKSGEFAHKDTREMLAVTSMKAARDTLLGEFRGEMGKATGLNADAAIASMRATLRGESPVADQTVIAMLNASGKLDGQDASTRLGMLAGGGDATVASAFYAGIDKSETIARWFGELKNTVTQKAEQLWNAGKAAAAPLLGTAQEGASTAADTAGGWFESLKEKASGLSFGGVFGSFGVGALFFLIANGLGGNSWFGKIVGVAAGVFGAVLGFKTFGPGDGQPAPDSTVSTAGLRNDGRAAQNPQLLRARDRERSSDIYNQADTNRDHVVSTQEQQAYMQKIAQEVAAINGRTSGMRGGVDTSVVDPFSYGVSPQPGQQPRQRR